jgi:hypothetical protein
MPKLYNSLVSHGIPGLVTIQFLFVSGCPSLGGETWRTEAATELFTLYPSYPAGHLASRSYSINIHAANSGYLS